MTWSDGTSRLSQHVFHPVNPRDLPSHKIYDAVIPVWWLRGFRIPLWRSHSCVMTAWLPNSSHGDRIPKKNIYVVVVCDVLLWWRRALCLLLALRRVHCSMRRHCNNLQQYLATKLQKLKFACLPLTGSNFIVCIYTYMSKHTYTCTCVYIYIYICI